MNNPRQIARSVNLIGVIADARWRPRNARDLQRAASTRPATAPNSRTRAGSRASGAVMIAVSSARSMNGGDGVRSGPSSGITRVRRARACATFSFRHADDRRDVDVVVVRVPAVVVRDHGDRRVAELGLARELRLRHVRHADDVAAPRAIEVRTQPASRTAGPPSRRTCRRAGTGSAPPLPRARARRRAFGHTGCAIDTCATKPGPKKLFSRAKRAVDELIDEHERGLAAGPRASEPQAEIEITSVTPGALERVDVRAVVDRRRRQHVAAAVARQEHELDARELAEQQRVRWRAERRARRDSQRARSSPSS